MIKSDELGLLAYKELKKMILQGAFAPGEKIVQDKLAARMGISRTPLRVALQMLEAENLIEPKSRSGYQIKVVDDKEILEIFDCRIALECTAARSFAHVIQPREKQKLIKFFEHFKPGAKIDADKYRKTDTQFHHFILENCGNKFLNKLFQQGNLFTYIERIGLIRTPEETMPEHMDIIDALVNQQPEAAERAMRIHLQRSKELVESKINLTHLTETVS